jgi:hypothetical protein
MARIPTVRGSFTRGIVALATLLLLASCASAPQAVDSTSGASPAGGDRPSTPAAERPAAPQRHVLVVYFSQGSATKRVAEDIATRLGADTEAIVEKVSRKGLFGFLSAGADSSLGKATPIEPTVRDPTSYDAVVVCTPVWAWHLAPPVRTWLRGMAGRLPDCAYVVVSANTAPEAIVTMMEEASGRRPVAYVGFVQKDFDTEAQPSYLEKVTSIVEALR